MNRVRFHVTAGAELLTSPVPSPGSRECAIVAAGPFVNWPGHLGRAQISRAGLLCEIWTRHAPADVHSVWRMLRQVIVLAPAQHGWEGQRALCSGTAAGIRGSASSASSLSARVLSEAWAQVYWSLLPVVVSCSDYASNQCLEHPDHLDRLSGHRVVGALGPKARPVRCERHELCVLDRKSILHRDHGEVNLGTRPET